MSLSLLQGYSSQEEEANDGVPEAEDEQLHDHSSDDDGGDAQLSTVAKRYDSSVFSFADPSLKNHSALPSAFDAFSQISRPPEFLSNSVEEQTTVRERSSHRGRKDRRDKRDLPSGAVLEAKAHLVGIHERVRSDIEGSKPPLSTVSGTTQDGTKRVVSAANPNAEDAAELLRMCQQCGVPKTYSSARGMVCPICSDRPPADPNQESKKKGSTVKDKEKIKRMRGQSSHATWKSETEMQLRQQFD